MEKQIGRIRAEENIRQFGVASAVGGAKEDRERFVELLTVELGETCKMKRNVFVAPQADAMARLMQWGNTVNDDGD